VKPNLNLIYHTMSCYVMLASSLAKWLAKSRS
jgi:hypothetical protein